LLVWAPPYAFDWSINVLILFSFMRIQRL
jgi:hypothetical protein